jgi:hypothetical protein
MNPRQLICLTALLLSACSDDHKDGVSSGSSDRPGKHSDRTASSTAPARKEAGRMPGSFLRSLEPELSVAERISHVRSLPGELSEIQLDELFRLLSGPRPGEISQSEWLVVGNEILEVLRHRDLRGLESRFTNLAADPAVDGVMRDYALQHYLRLQQSRLEALSETDGNDEAESLVAALEADTRRILATENRGTQTILGTGFMGLAALCRQLDEPALTNAVTGVVRDLALPLIEHPGEDALTANVTSAIQISSQLKLPEAEQPIRQLAFGDDTDPSLRLNSVYGLRYYSNPLDVEPLRKLAQSRKPIHFVAQETLAVIEQQNSHSTE